MNPDFDIIIVGSGPAGVSVAFPMLASGLKILMVDGGRKPNISLPKDPFLIERAQNEAQWKWMVGENFHALRTLKAISPKLRVPAHQYVFEEFEAANSINSQQFAALGSLAIGGLSNVWGCGVARLTETELKEFPFDVSEIEQSYESVARRIGISGCHEDDLSDYFGLDAWAQPPIQMDKLHHYVFKNYIKHKTAHRALVGFRLGRSRVAVLSEDHAQRKACDISGSCLWGCQRRALYSAADELPLLQRNSNFYYESGFVVKRLTRHGDVWSVEGLQNGEYRFIKTRKVLLAAGTLATTRLVMQTLNLTRSVPIHSCPTAAFLLCLPLMLGVEKRPTFGLGQLSFSLALPDKVSAFGSSFGVTGIPVSEFIQYLPFRKRYGISMLKSLLSSCLVGNVFLSGDDFSTTRAKLGNDGSLNIEGGYSDKVTLFMVETEKRLRKAYWKLGAVLLPKSFTVGKPGVDIHYACSLPMRWKPLLGETNALGEVNGLKGVHIVDGACLSSLSEKSHTLTIMANADRIGRKLVKMGK